MMATDQPTSIASAPAGNAAPPYRLHQLRKRIPGSDALHDGAFAVSPDMSMTPTFNEGDLLEIDSRYKKVTCEGIYAFEINGQQYVRRLARTGSGDGSVHMICDNKAFPSFWISPSEARGLKIFGRVRTAWVTQRL